MRYWGAPVVRVDDGPQPGIYEVSGYVNAGKRGFIYVEAFNDLTGDKVMLADDEERTNEFVGWSDVPREEFYFNVEAMCKVGDWENEYPATFEVWFKPDDGSGERLLAKSRRRIFGWQR